ncbi:hypothetical protein GQ53DRAFT_37902 [Thozetella sp. PMI_491]|nr:hypothetical protein GQ53DRAFT_37902 [Thozetella sp. PMI_491]
MPYARCLIFEVATFFVALQGTGIGGSHTREGSSLAATATKTVWENSPSVTSRLSDALSGTRPPDCRFPFSLPNKVSDIFHLKLQS